MTGSWLETLETLAQSAGRRQENKQTKDLRRGTLNKQWTAL